MQEICAKCGTVDNAHHSAQCVDSTLVDLKAKLSNYGLVAVPLKPSQAMIEACEISVEAGCFATGICNDIIAAAQEQSDE